MCARVVSAQNKTLKQGGEILTAAFRLICPPDRTCRFGLGTQMSMSLDLKSGNLNIFKGQGKNKKLRNRIFHPLLAFFQSCSFMDLGPKMLETPEERQGHSSDKSEPGRNDSLNF